MSVLYSTVTVLYISIPDLSSGLAVGEDDLELGRQIETVLYCSVLHCTALYCTVLFCTALYCTVLYCTVFYCTVLNFTLPGERHTETEW